jgi:hypothetical protein
MWEPCRVRHFQPDVDISCAWMSLAGKVGPQSSGKSKGYALSQVGTPLAP